jgi:hypothetical protein
VLLRRFLSRLVSSTSPVWSSGEKSLNRGPLVAPQIACAPANSQNLGTEAFKLATTKFRFWEMPAA